jgi:hypothetical protein
MKFTRANFCILGVFAVCATGVGAQAQSGVDINWGLLRTPDYAGDYARAYQQGQRVAAERAPREEANAGPRDPRKSILTFRKMESKRRTGRKRRDES